MAIVCRPSPHKPPDKKLSAQAPHVCPLWILHESGETDDPRPAVLRPRPTPGASGLGLHIVAQSAAEWGCSPRWSGGKVVWAVLTSRGRTG
ncbi:hypothetical protein AB0J55_12510 [Amycolatopsis sp. NPDC049688]|uniref:hypothetical protein n=1 Tax=Amycolatopsis sp. NPDC049688 TaxID=3154733 RepID=UPI0034426753